MTSNNFHHNFTSFLVFLLTFDLFARTDAGAMQNPNPCIPIIASATLDSSTYTQTGINTFTYKQYLTLCFNCTAGDYTLCGLCSACARSQSTVSTNGPWTTPVYSNSSPTVVGTCGSTGNCTSFLYTADNVNSSIYTRFQFAYTPLDMIGNCSTNYTIYQTVKISPVTPTAP